MITEALLAIVMGLVNWIVSIVPDFGLDVDLDLAQSFQLLGGYAYTMNGWFPVAILGGAVVLVLITQMGVTVWGFIVWLYHQFWGSN